MGERQGEGPPGCACSTQAGSSHPRGRHPTSGMTAASRWQRQCTGSPRVTCEVLRASGPLGRNFLGYFPLHVGTACEPRSRGRWARQAQETSWCPRPLVTTSGPVTEVTKNLPRLPQAGPRCGAAGLGASAAPTGLARAARGGGPAAPRRGGLSPEAAGRVHLFWGGGHPDPPDQSLFQQKPQTPRTLQCGDGMRGSRRAYSAAIETRAQGTSDDPRVQRTVFKRCGGRGWGVAVACPTLLREGGWLSGTRRTWEVTGRTRSRLWAPGPSDPAPSSGARAGLAVKWPLSLRHSYRPTRTLRTEDGRGAACGAHGGAAPRALHPQHPGEAAGWHLWGGPR